MACEVNVVNGTSQESAWEQPQAHFAFMQELGDLVGLVDQLDGDLSGIDPSSMAGLVGCLATHSRDAGVLGRVAHILAAMGRDAGALDHLADMAGLENLVAALEHCGGDEAVLMDASELLGNLAQLDKMKARLGLREYVAVLNCVEINRWFGGSPPNFRTLYLNQIEVDSADFGRIDCSRRVLEARQKTSRQNLRLRAH